jgi:hypothetical protein
MWPNMPILGVIASGITGNLATNSFFAIATANPGGTGSVTFDSGGEWANYTHLYASFISRCASAGPNATLLMYLNGDTTTSNYIGEQVEWDGTNNGNVYPNSGGFPPFTAMAGNSRDAGYFASGFAYFSDINATGKYRTVRADGAFVQDGTSSGFNNYTTTMSTYKLNTNALTSITFSAGGPNFITGTSIALYGIKG